jgi:hypothetical protein
VSRRQALAIAGSRRPMPDFKCIEGDSTRDIVKICPAQLFPL